jgi:prolyl-tRNA editing enzyme YbaK/EbsC (Cys-tRNA(Pro) deacylase)
VFSTPIPPQIETALRRVLEELGIPRGGRIELPSATSYPRYVDHVAALDEWDLVCRSGGMDEILLSMRSIKDPETGDLRKAFFAHQHPHR